MFDDIVKEPAQDMLCALLARIGDATHVLQVNSIQIYKPLLSCWLQYHVNKPTKTKDLVEGFVPGRCYILYLIYEHIELLHVLDLE